MNSNSALWVGRWWLPYVTLSWCLLIVGCVLFLFPKSLPGVKKIREKAIAKGDLKERSKELEEMRKLGFMGFVKSCLNLISNKFLVLAILGATSKVFIATGVGPFYTKFLILKFNVKASQAAVTLGSVLIVSSTCKLP